MYDFLISVLCFCVGEVTIGGEHWHLQKEATLCHNGEPFPTGN
jgi:hypothetical protein